MIVRLHKCGQPELGTLLITSDVLVTL